MNGVSASECWRCEADLSVADALLEVVSRVAAPEPASPDVSHLAPCRHCGAMNGVSAAACWQCESRLSVAGSIGAEALQPDDETPDPASTPPAASFPDDESMVPALRSSMPEHRPQMARSASSARAVRRRRLAVAAIALVSVLAFSTSLAWRAWFADGPVPPLVSAEVAGSSGFAASPLPDLSPDARAPSGLDAPARAEVQSANLRSEATNVRGGAAAQPRSKRPATALALAETQRGAGRSASRVAGVAVTGVAPEPARFEPAPAPAASTRECTATVAALGLCAAPTNQPKE